MQTRRAHHDIEAAGGVFPPTYRVEEQPEEVSSSIVELSSVPDETMPDMQAGLASSPDPSDAQEPDWRNELIEHAMAVKRARRSQTDQWWRQRGSSSGHGSR
jgi:hypothetical protein